MPVESDIDMMSTASTADEPINVDGSDSAIAYVPYDFLQS